MRICLTPLKDICTSQAFFRPVWKKNRAKGWVCYWSPNTSRCHLMISSDHCVIHSIPLLTVGINKCGSACFAAQSAEDDPLWSRCFLSALKDPAASARLQWPHSSAKHKPAQHMAHSLQHPYKEPYTVSTYVILWGSWGSDWTDDFLTCEDISLIRIQISSLFFCQWTHFVWTQGGVFKKQMQNNTCQTAICGRLWMLVMWLIIRAGSTWQLFSMLWQERPNVSLQTVGLPFSRDRLSSSQTWQMKG